ncbi:hypothetical protein DPMN_010258 [Dreissena polymorpha]|uniref:Uncharacterized protein n=1 Tax=Dreissena polymorpha TaxID=45954 RepID=A0A9D4N217_DREPO|nr:hypothetical protein DPMN_010258 [Dreissena polymorpha]
MFRRYPRHLPKVPTALFFPIRSAAACLVSSSFDRNSTRTNLLFSAGDADHQLALVTHPNPNMPDVVVLHYVPVPGFCIVNCLVCSPLPTFVDFPRGPNYFLVCTVSQHLDLPDCGKFKLLRKREMGSCILLPELYRPIL